MGAGPERPRRPGRLPDRRLRVRHRPADVQRRRRLDGALRRRLAAPDAVRLPRPLARRRRRRLAADVRGARAALRPHRAPGRRGGVSRSTRPTRRAPTCRCRRCRSAAASWTWCARTTGSAGTGGPRRARSSRRPYEGRHPCAQWGSCMQGCPEGAKASTDVTHWPQAIARGARLLTRRARDAAAARPGRARHGRRVRGRGGQRRDRAEADVVVLAANAIGTARLLLLSACDAFPDGLANTQRSRRPAADDAPVRGRDRRLRRAARDLAGQRRLAHPLAAVLRERRAPRLRARREVEPRAVDRRADERRDAGPRRRGRLGRRASRARARALRPLPELGHLRRGPARRRQPRHARSGARRRERRARAARDLPGVGELPAAARLPRRAGARVAARGRRARASTR